MQHAPSAASAALPAVAGENPPGFDRAYVEKFGLLGFLRVVWPRLEPGIVFQENWHIPEICTHLEAIAEGEIRKLLINIPPGESKTTIVSKAFPAWDWIANPGRRVISASYVPGIATLASRAQRELVDSDWFRVRWPHVELLDRADSDFRNTHQGFRFATAVRGRLTGRHAHGHIIDDPVNAKSTLGKAAFTRADLDFANLWFDGALSTRVVNQKTLWQVIVMQRLHEVDLSGHVLAKGGWEHLCLPHRFEVARASRTSVGGDRRTYEGELLDKLRWDEETLKAAEDALGEQVPGQFQQRPARAGGQIFKAAWFKFYAESPDYYHANPWTFDEIVISADCSFKDALGSDHVCFQVWGRKGALFYLLDQILEVMSFAQTVSTFRALCMKWPTAFTKLVEDKANGPALISILQEHVPGLVAVEPKGGKVARANAVTGMYRAGNVLYPAPGPERPWVMQHVTNMMGFPLVAHDDDVDAETQALAELAEHAGLGHLWAALARNA